MERCMWVLGFHDLTEKLFPLSNRPCELILGEKFRADGAAQEEDPVLRFGLRLGGEARSSSGL